MLDYLSPSRAELNPIGPGRRRTCWKGGSSSSSTATSNADQRIAFESGVGISGDQSTATVSINTVESEVATRALDTVRASDATNAAGFQSLLNTGEAGFTALIESNAAAEQARADAARAAEDARAAEHARAIASQRAAEEARAAEAARAIAAQRAVEEARAEEQNRVIASLRQSDVARSDEYQRLLNQTDAMNETNADTFGRLLAADRADNETNAGTFSNLVSFADKLFTGAGDLIMGTQKLTMDGYADAQQAAASAVDTASSAAKGTIDQRTIIVIAIAGAVALSFINRR